jgi:nucleosome binding factor SPN SPT16 subunit
MELAIKEKKFMPSISDLDDLDVCYPAIIQSGGNFSFKFNVIRWDQHLPSLNLRNRIKYFFVFSTVTMSI